MGAGNLAEAVSIKPFYCVHEVFSPEAIGVLGPCPTCLYAF